MKSMMYKLTGCIVMAAWVLGGVSCTNEEITTEVAESKGEPWIITATQGGGATTKLGYTDEGNSGVTVTWSAADAFTVFGGANSKAKFTLQSGANEKSATFTGTKPTGDAPYKAFYPALADASTITAHNDCVMDFTGQTQTGNGDMTHLSKYDYMTGTVAFNDNDPTVSFEHQALMMKFVLTLPAALDGDETLEVLSVTAEKDGEAKPLSLKKGISGTDKDYTSDTQELILKNVSLVDGNTLTAYMMMYPFELAVGDELIIKIQGNKNIYSGTVTVGNGGKEYKKGYRYTVTPSTLTASPIPTGTALIPSGTFQMGQAEITGATPVHSVTLTRSFYMSKFEITNAQYAAFLNAKKTEDVLKYGEAGSGSDIYQNAAYINSTEALVLDCNTDSRSQWGVTHNVDGSWSAVSGKENYPVIYVSWFGAKAFADWAGASLPTEAQWEYACRAGADPQTIYSFGDNATDLGSYGWYSANNTTGGYLSGTKPVGLKDPNAYGLYDIHGNVFEWCADRHSEGNDTYSSNSVSDPVAATGVCRVFRGGYWGGSAGSCRSAYRYYGYPNSAYNYYGFRVLFFP